MGNEDCVDVLRSIHVPDLVDNNDEDEVAVGYTQSSATPKSVPTDRQPPSNIEHTPVDHQTAGGCGDAVQPSPRSTPWYDHHHRIASRLPIPSTTPASPSTATSTHPVAFTSSSPQIARWAQNPPNSRQLFATGTSQSRASRILFPSACRRTRRRCDDETSTKGSGRTDAVASGPAHVYRLQQQQQQQRARPPGHMDDD